mgnify:CR=1 FL=1
MGENLHLWHADRGTYYDRNVNIISWSDEYHINLGKYNSIGRDCSFFLHANHRPDWITTSSQLLGPVSEDIENMMFEMGHPSCKGNITIENDVWIGATSVLLDGATLEVGCVVGACSLVRGSTDPYGIYAGNPLVKRGERIEK